MSIAEVKRVIPYSMVENIGLNVKIFDSNS